jgi:hypothetical protein
MDAEEMAQSTFESARCWKLPPLILHPFAEASGPDRLTASSRASLILQGLLPGEEFNLEELNRWILEGRFYEVRMLFYIGKDLNRWIGQSMEVVEREDALREGGVRRESFAAMLVEDPPSGVQEKLRSWGVSDHKTIFRRALGLNAVFADVPLREMLTDEFVRHHFRYADRMFECRQQSARFTPVHGENFPFEMYASGEYARMLEREWDV